MLLVIVHTIAEPSLLSILFSFLWMFYCCAVNDDAEGAGA